MFKLSDDGSQTPPEVFPDEMDRDARQERLVKFDKVEVGKKLENWRRSLRPKITQKKMAERMGVCARTYFKYESGETQIPLDKLSSLAEWCDLDLNELIVGDKDRAGWKYRASVAAQTVQAMAYAKEYYDRQYSKELSELQQSEVAVDYVTHFGAETKLDRWMVEYLVDGRFEKLLVSPFENLDNPDEYEA